MLFVNFTALRAMDRKQFKKFIGKLRTAREQHRKFTQKKYGMPIGRSILRHYAKTINDCIGAYTKTNGHIKGI